MSADTLKTGNYLVEAACPRCGAIEEILCSIRTVLTTPEDDTGSLKVRIKGKPRDHDCRQIRVDQLTLDRSTVDAVTRPEG